MPKILFLFLLQLLLSCDRAYVQQIAAQVLAITERTDTTSTDTYKVIGIKDGDTIVLLMDSTEQVVRLGQIDCPERRQPFGTRAKQFVSDSCFGEYVSLLIDEKNKYDRNKRLIAEIILADGTNLNKELVRNGLAWHYVQYSKDESYALLEQGARENKFGVWSEPNPIAPWEWRKTPKRK